jgi:uncharacterized protein involved in type VI secretion and phage assembly
MSEPTNADAGNRSPDKRFYGKYRGVVASNIDPMFMGRLLVQVHDVLEDDPCIWANPALPAAGAQMGVFALPPVNGGVWVEFEQGDPKHAIWVGCWAANASELPAQALVPPPPISNFVLQTTGQNSLEINDLPGPTGGIIIKSKLGAMIVLNDTGIYITNGKGASIVMTGPTVTINQGALVIT